MLGLRVPGSGFAVSQAWGHLARGTRHAATRDSFLGVGKFTVQAQAGSLCRLASQRGLGWACELGGTGSQGITKVGQSVLARLFEIQTWCLPELVDCVCGEGSTKEQ